MRNILALIVFIPLQILFIPLAIVGAIWVGYKQLVVSKRLGVEAGRHARFSNSN